MHNPLGLQISGRTRGWQWHAEGPNFDSRLLHVQESQVKDDV